MIILSMPAPAALRFDANQASRSGLCGAAVLQTAATPNKGAAPPTPPHGATSEMQGGFDMGHLGRVVN
jgi:hypothetical protein